MLRRTLGFGAAAACLFACARAPSSAARSDAKAPTSVARHVMVLVSEDVGDEKRDSIVIAEPLEEVHREAVAFHVTNSAYHVAFAWDSAPKTGRCLAITVTRNGDPLGPDFKASGCVPIDEPAATVATLDRAGGGTIEVGAWFFDASAPLPESEPPRPTLEALTRRSHSGGSM